MNSIFHSAKYHASIPYRLFKFIIDIFIIKIINTLYKDNNKIICELCIIKTDLIGDFFIWHSALPSSLRDLIANEGLIICNEVLGDYIRDNNIAKNIVTLNRVKFIKNYRYRVNFFKLLLRIESTYTLNASPSRQLLIDDAISYAISGYKIGSIGCENSQTIIEGYIGRIGYDKLEKLDSHKSEFYNQVFLNKNLCSLMKLAYIDNKTYDDNIELGGNEYSSDYLAVSVFTSWSPRAWPQDNWILVFEELLMKYPFDIFLVGAPGDFLGGELNSYISLKPRIKLVIGELSVLQLVELIKGSKLVIANETSLVHIAAKYGVPSVCILGGGHFQRYLPYVDEIPNLLEPHSVYKHMDCFGCNWRCNNPQFDGNCVPCIRNIDAKDVIFATQNVLD